MDSHLAVLDALEADIAAARCLCRSGNLLHGGGSLLRGLQQELLVDLLVRRQELLVSPAELLDVPISTLEVSGRTVLVLCQRVLNLREVLLQPADLQVSVTQLLLQSLQALFHG